MPRILRSFLVLALVMVAATNVVGAQAPAAGGSQTVTGMGGYQYQVPADWQQIPYSRVERMGSQVFSFDGVTASADGNQHGHVEAATGFGATASSLQDVLNAFFAGPSATGASMSVFDGPNPVQVPNAEAAQSGAATYTDPDGNQRIVAARVALKGQTAYLLALDVTQDFYTSNPSFGQIMSSFRLAGGGGS